MDGKDKLDTYCAKERGRAVGLARALNISPQYVCDLRRGRRRPTLDMAFRIEELTGVPASSWRKAA